MLSSGLGSGSRVTGRFRYSEFVDRRELEEARVFAQSEMVRTNAEQFNEQLRREGYFFDAVRRDQTAALTTSVLVLLTFYVLRWVLVGRLRPLWPLRRSPEASEA